MSYRGPPANRVARTAGRRRWSTSAWPPPVPGVATPPHSGVTRPPAVSSPSNNRTRRSLRNVKENKHQPMLIINQTDVGRSIWKTLGFSKTHDNYRLNSPRLCFREPTRSPIVAGAWKSRRISRMDGASHRKPNPQDEKGLNSRNSKLGAQSDGDSPDEYSQELGSTIAPFASAHPSHGGCAILTRDPRPRGLPLG